MYELERQRTKMNRTGSLKQIVKEPSLVYKGSNNVTSTIDLNKSTKDG